MRCVPRRHTGPCPECQANAALPTRHRDDAGGPLFLLLSLRKWGHICIARSDRTRPTHVCARITCAAVVTLSLLSARKGGGHHRPRNLVGRMYRKHGHVCHQVRAGGAA